MNQIDQLCVGLNNNWHNIRKHLYTFYWQRPDVSWMECGFLGIPVTTKMANEEIILDTTDFYQFKEEIL